MKKILIVGGLGYIGGRLTKHLCDRGFDVRISTRKKEFEFPENIPHRCEIISVDYTSQADVNNSMNDINIVIHLAGPDSHTNVKNSTSLINDHIQLTQDLLVSSIQNNIEKFIYFSTIHVYGNNLIGKITEKTKPKPIYPFAKAHFEAEKYLLSKNVGINTIIIRCSNSFGVPFFKNSRCWKLVVNQFCKTAIEEGIIKVNSPNEHRNFIPINRICDSIENEINHNGNSKMINLGNSKSTPIIEMAKKIQSIVNQNFSLDCLIETNNFNQQSYSKEFSLDNIVKNINTKISELDEFGLLLNELKKGKVESNYDFK